MALLLAAAAALAFLFRSRPHGPGAAAMGGAVGPGPAALRPRTRVLAVGFDGLSFDVVRPWLAEGRMPNLARLVAEGASGPLRTIIPPSSPPAWTSAVTGVNPGKHGIFGFLRPLGPSLKPEFVTGADREVVALWTLLSRAGLRVGFVNVPCSSPPEPVNGFLVGGFPHPAGGAVAFPAGLLARYPSYQVDVFADKPAPGQEEAWLARLRTVEQARLALARDQLAEGGLDLFFVVFTGTDRIQHFFWKHMDPMHPLHDPALAARFGFAIRDFHQEMDRALGVLVETAGPGAVTLVVSDHGFGPLHKGISALPLQAYLSPDLRPGEQPKAYLWSFFGGILYLGLRGREPFGTVAPGAEYEARRELLADLLRRATDPETGAALVQSVHRREEIYQGDALARAPDLVFLESDGYLVTKFPSPRLVDVLPPDFFSGFHRLDGVLAAHGPGIRPGARVEGARLIDLAPTVLHLLGEPVPAHMDGRVLAALFAPGGELAREPRRVALEETAWKTRGRAEGADEAVEEQLRSLGYVQ